MAIKRIINLLLLFSLSNIWIFATQFRIPVIVNSAVFFALLAFFMFYNINPREEKAWTARIEVLMGARELLMNFLLMFFVEAVLYGCILLLSNEKLNAAVLIVNGVICLTVLFILLWNGMIRAITTSTQLSLFARVSLFLVWWVPIANIFLIWHCCRVIHMEYLFDMAKKELDGNRKENEICRTKYPILLVHGIFWRDWQLFNYWGRIPKELIRNGATVYYGNQQSAAPMEVVSGELKKQILSIVAREKCDKVNIIAHSKGGLDARYMISCLGMESYVGSLTTIGTPHTGSVLVDKILNIVPDSVFKVIAKRYNAIYKKLGDAEPDFYSGVRDLKTEQCTLFNQAAVNKENVLYQSIASKMYSFFSAGLPLNVGYAILQHYEGQNDGFVSIESSKWGQYLGCLSTKRTRGVSHGDMIDLMRENIQGFDVCECYVDIVKGLKSKDL
jgi:triacylglycerol lipase